jgi:hypothetical protein
LPGRGPTSGRSTRQTVRWRRSGPDSVWRRLATADDGWQRLTTAGRVADAWCQVAPSSRPARVHSLCAEVAGRGAVNRSRVSDLNSIHHRRPRLHAGTGRSGRS